MKIGTVEAVLCDECTVKPYDSLNVKNAVVKAVLSQGVHHLQCCCPSRRISHHSTPHCSVLNEYHFVTSPSNHPWTRRQPVGRLRLLWAISLNALIRLSSADYGLIVRNPPTDNTEVIRTQRQNMIYHCIFTCFDPETSS